MGILDKLNEAGDIERRIERSNKGREARRSANYASSGLSAPTAEEQINESFKSKNLQKVINQTTNSILDKNNASIQDDEKKKRAEFLNNQIKEKLKEDLKGVQMENLGSTGFNKYEQRKREEGFIQDQVLQYALDNKINTPEVERLSGDIRLDTLEQAKVYHEDQGVGEVVGRAAYGVVETVAQTPYLIASEAYDQNLVGRGGVSLEDQNMGLSYLDLFNRDKVRKAIELHKDEDEYKDKHASANLLLDRGGIVDVAVIALELGSVVSGGLTGAAGVGLKTADMVAKTANIAKGLKGVEDFAGASEDVLKAFSYIANETKTLKEARSVLKGAKLKEFDALYKAANTARIAQKGGHVSSLTDIALGSVGYSSQSKALTAFNLATPIVTAASQETILGDALNVALMPGTEAYTWIANNADTDEASNFKKKKIEKYMDGISTDNLTKKQWKRLEDLASDELKYATPSDLWREDEDMGELELRLRQGAELLVNMGVFTKAYAGATKIATNKNSKNSKYNSANTAIQEAIAKLDSFDKGTKEYAEQKKVVDEKIDSAEFLNSPKIRAQIFTAEKFEEVLSGLLSDIDGIKEYDQKDVKEKIDNYRKVLDNPSSTSESKEAAITGINEITENIYKNEKAKTSKVKRTAELYQPYLQKLAQSIVVNREKKTIMGSLSKRMATRIENGLGSFSRKISGMFMNGTDSNTKRHLKGNTVAEAIYKNNKEWIESFLDPKVKKELGLSGNDGERNVESIGLMLESVEKEGDLNHAIYNYHNKVDSIKYTPTDLSSAVNLKLKDKLVTSLKEKGVPEKKALAAAEKLVENAQGKMIDNSINAMINLKKFDESIANDISNALFDAIGLDTGVSKKGEGLNSFINKFPNDKNLYKDPIFNEIETNNKELLGHYQEIHNEIKNHQKEIDNLILESKKMEPIIQFHESTPKDKEKIAEETVSDPDVVSKDFEDKAEIAAAEISGEVKEFVREKKDSDEKSSSAHEIRKSVMKNNPSDIISRMVENVNSVFFKEDPSKIDSIESLKEKANNKADTILEDANNFDPDVLGKEENEITKGVVQKIKSYKGDEKADAILSMLGLNKSEVAKLKKNKKSIQKEMDININILKKYVETTVQKENDFEVLTKMNNLVVGKYNSPEEIEKAKTQYGILLQQLSPNKREKIKALDTNDIFFSDDIRKAVNKSGNEAKDSLNKTVALNDQIDKFSNELNALERDIRNSSTDKEYFIELAKNKHISTPGKINMFWNAISVTHGIPLKEVRINFPYKELSKDLNRFSDNYTPRVYSVTLGTLKDKDGNVMTTFKEDNENALVNDSGVAINIDRNKSTLEKQIAEKVTGSKEGVVDILTTFRVAGKNTNAQSVLRDLSEHANSIKDLKDVNNKLNPTKEAFLKKISGYRNKKKSLSLKDLALLKFLETSSGKTIIAHSANQAVVHGAKDQEPSATPSLNDDKVLQNASQKSVDSPDDLKVDDAALIFFFEYIPQIEKSLGKDILLSMNEVGSSLVLVDKGTSEAHFKSLFLDGKVDQDGTTIKQEADMSYEDKNKLAGRINKRMKVLASKDIKLSKVDVIRSYQGGIKDSLFKLKNKNNNIKKNYSVEIDSNGKERTLSGEESDKNYKEDYAGLLERSKRGKIKVVITKDTDIDPITGSTKEGPKKYGPLDGGMYMMPHLSSMISSLTGQAKNLIKFVVADPELTYAFKGQGFTMSDPRGFFSGAKEGDSAFGMNKQLKAAGVNPNRMLQQDLIIDETAYKAITGKDLDFKDGKAITIEINIDTLASKSQGPKKDTSKYGELFSATTIKPSYKVLGFNYNFDEKGAYSNFQKKIESKKTNSFKKAEDALKRVMVNPANWESILEKAGIYLSNDDFSGNASYMANTGMVMNDKTLGRLKQAIAKHFLNNAIKGTVSGAGMMSIPISHHKSIEGYIEKNKKDQGYNKDNYAVVPDSYKDKVQMVDGVPHLIVSRNPGTKLTSVTSVKVLFEGELKASGIEVETNGGMMLNPTDLYIFKEGDNDGDTLTVFTDDVYGGVEAVKYYNTVRSKLFESEGATKYRNNENIKAFAEGEVQFSSSESIPSQLRSIKGDSGLNKKDDDYYKAIQNVSSNYYHNGLSLEALFEKIEKARKLIIEAYSDKDGQVDPTSMTYTERHIYNMDTSEMVTLLDSTGEYEGPAHEEALKSINVEDIDSLMGKADISSSAKDKASRLYRDYLDKANDKYLDSDLASQKKYEEELVNARKKANDRATQKGRIDQRYADEEYARLIKDIPNNSKIYNLNEDKKVTSKKVIELYIKSKRLLPYFKENKEAKVYNRNGDLIKLEEAKTKEEVNGFFEKTSKEEQAPLWATYNSEIFYNNKELLNHYENDLKSIEDSIIKYRVKVKELGKEKARGFLSFMKRLDKKNNGSLYKGASKLLIENPWSIATDDFKVSNVPFYDILNQEVVKDYINTFNNAYGDKVTESVYGNSLSDITSKIEEKLGKPIFDLNENEINSAFRDVSGENAKIPKSKILKSIKKGPRDFFEELLIKDSYTKSEIQKIFSDISRLDAISKGENYEKIDPESFSEDVRSFIEGRKQKRKEALHNNSKNNGDKIVAEYQDNQRKQEKLKKEIKSKEAKAKEALASINHNEQFNKYLEFIAKASYKKTKEERVAALQDYIKKDFEESKSANVKDSISSAEARKAEQLSSFNKKVYNAFRKDLLEKKNDGLTEFLYNISKGQQASSMSTMLGKPIFEAIQAKTYIWASDYRYFWNGPKEHVVKQGGEYDGIKISEESVEIPEISKDEVKFPNEITDGIMKDPEALRPVENSLEKNNENKRKEWNVLESLEKGKDLAIGASKFWATVTGRVLGSLLNAGEKITHKAKMSLHDQHAEHANNLYQRKIIESGNKLLIIKDSLLSSKQKKEKARLLKNYKQQANRLANKHIYDYSQNPEFAKVMNTSLPFFQFLFSTARVFHGTRRASVPLASALSTLNNTFGEEQSTWDDEAKHYVSTGKTLLALPFLKFFNEGNNYFMDLTRHAGADINAFRNISPNNIYRTYQSQLKGDKKIRDYNYENFEKGRINEAEFLANYVSGSYPIQFIKEIGYQAKIWDAPRISQTHSMVSALTGISIKDQASKDVFTAYVTGDYKKLSTYSDRQFQELADTVNPGRIKKGKVELTPGAIRGDIKKNELGLTDFSGEDDASVGYQLLDKIAIIKGGDEEISEIPLYKDIASKYYFKSLIFGRENFGKEYDPVKVGEYLDNVSTFVSSPEYGEWAKTYPEKAKIYKNKADNIEWYKKYYGVTTKDDTKEEDFKSVTAKYLSLQAKTKEKYSTLEEKEKAIYNGEASLLIKNGEVVPTEEYDFYSKQHGQVTAEYLSKTRSLEAIKKSLSLRKSSLYEDGWQKAPNFKNRHKEIQKLETLWKNGFKNLLASSAPVAEAYKESFDQKKESSIERMNKGEQDYTSPNLDEFLKKINKDLNSSYKAYTNKVFPSWTLQDRQKEGLVEGNGGLSKEEALDFANQYR